MAFGGIFLAAGIGAAAAAGSASLAAFAGVAVAAFLYDFALKRLGLLGALILGLCRGGSVLAAALTSPTFEALLRDRPGRALLLPLPWLLQGVAVTAASLLEESPRGRALAPAAAAGILLPSALAFPLLAVPGERSLGFAIAAVALFTYVLGRALARSRLGTGTEAVGAVVREGVFGFLLLDATVLGLRGAAWPSAGAVALWMALRVVLRSNRS
jgi:4-hydroxybenzoate polyprenyltransferase